MYEDDKKLSLRDLPAPTAGEDSAVLQVGASSICGTDLRTYRHGSAKIHPPRVIGHEAVGTLVAVGRNLRGFAVGERVQVAPAIGCGTCPLCRKGHSNLCDSLETIGFQYDGTFAEYMEVPAAAFQRGNVSHVPATVPDTQAVLAEPIACVINAHQFLNIQAGDTVAIFGSGFIGCMHAELALLSGAEAVFMIELNATRAEMARRLNPRMIMLDPTQVDLRERILSETGGMGVQVAIVACSVGSAQTDAMNVTANLR